MPEDLIAIGDDGNGDKLCFQVINGKMSKKIYLWDHETNEIEEYAPNLIEFVKLESEAEEG